MKQQLEDHEIAGLFGLATQDELSGLADDIAKHGQIETIDMFEGKILDGRNRYRACLTAGVKPRLGTWTPNGVAPLDYVLAKNLHRRHLTIAQRAALAVRLIDYERDEAHQRMVDGGKKAGRGRPSEKGSPNTDTPISKGRAAQRAAEKVGVGRTSVLAAELIAEKSPETFEKMKKGEISVTKAATEAGIGTGTYTKHKPRKKISAKEMQNMATAADNIHSAHFYAGLASSAIPAFDEIPDRQIPSLVLEAQQAIEWWEAVLVSLQERNPQ